MRKKKEPDPPGEQTTRPDAKPARKRDKGRQEPRADGTETIEDAAKKWPTMTPWPLPAPGHSNVGTAGWADRALLGGPEPVADKLGVGPSVLLIHITQAHALRTATVVRQVTVARHDEFGEFFLRAVVHLGGVLLGVVDSTGHTYCACEWYDKGEAEAGWADWIRTLNQ